MMNYAIKYDYSMGHEYRGYVAKADDGTFIPFCEADGCTFDDAFRFETKEEAEKVLKYLNLEGNAEILTMVAVKNKKYRKINVVQPAKKTNVNNEVKSLFNHFFIGKKYKLEDVVGYLEKKNIKDFCVYKSMCHFSYNYNKSSYEIDYKEDDGFIQLASIVKIEDDLVKSEEVAMKKAYEYGLF